MNGNPIISVIVPVYNTAASLPRCVDSILNQTYDNIEVILVDDGSPDGAGDICDRYAARDARVRVIHQANAGVSAARNAGIDASRGDMLAFCDSDDFIDAEMYATLIRIIGESDADVACCAYMTQSALSDTPEKATGVTTEPDVSVCNRDDALRRLLCSEGISYSACDKLIRRDAVKDIRFDLSIYHNEDLLFVYRVICNARRVVRTDRAYYVYCDTPGSAVHSSFSERRMTALRAQDIILGDICERHSTLARTAETEYIKFNIYTASQMSADGYRNPTDRARVRLNVKKRLGTLLGSRLAPGYKLRGVLLCVGWRPYDAYIRAVKAKTRD